MEDKDISARVLLKIDAYQPKGGLDHTAKVFLALFAVNHAEVKSHMERVALLSEVVALRLEKDAKAAFFAGLLHDAGKLVLQSDLFDDREITAEEYKIIKDHALHGFKILYTINHSFVALCAGFNHALYENGYGLSANEFPENFNPKMVREALEISAIVSICDFIDAYIHRKAKIADGSEKAEKCICDLKEKLYEKYPNDHRVIDIALEEKDNVWQIKSALER